MFSLPSKRLVEAPTVDIQNPTLCGVCVTGSMFGAALHGFSSG
jgi:hypothetical protein